MIEDKGYVGEAASVRLYPEAIDAMASLVGNFRLALVTNQAGIARGLYSWAGFAAVQGIIDAAMNARGARLDAVLACAYHADGRSPYDVADHPWRKPRPGMIVEALRRLNGMAACSALVGDQPSDMAAARAAGLGTAVLIDRTGAANVDSVDADAVVRTLGEAVAFLT